MPRIGPRPALWLGCGRDALPFGLGGAGATGPRPPARDCRVCSRSADHQGCLRTRIGDDTADGTDRPKGPPAQTDVSQGMTKPLPEPRPGVEADQGFALGQQVQIGKDEDFSHGIRRCDGGGRVGDFGRFERERGESEPNPWLTRKTPGCNTSGLRRYHVGIFHSPPAG